MPHQVFKQCARVLPDTRQKKDLQSETGNNYRRLIETTASTNKRGEKHKISQTLSVTTNPKVKIVRYYSDIKSKNNSVQLFFLK